MPNFTPQQIVDEMHKSDKELELLAKQFAWFKGQRDFWKATYELQVARKTLSYDGSAATTKAKPYGITKAAEFFVEIPWLPGESLSLLDMVLLTEASFDLISKEYNRMETHIMILQSVNKNVMQDYGRAGANEWAH